MLKRFILLTMEHGENLSVLTNVSLFEKINAAFRHSITEKQMEIPESYIQSIVVSILLIVERSKALLFYIQLICLIRALDNQQDRNNDALDVAFWDLHLRKSVGYRRGAPIWKIVFGI